MNYIFSAKGCCVQLKVKWTDNAGKVSLSVRPPGYKDFVDIVDTEQLIKQINYKKTSLF